MTLIAVIVDVLALYGAPTRSSLQIIQFWKQRDDIMSNVSGVETSSTRTYVPLASCEDTSRSPSDSNLRRLLPPTNARDFHDCSLATHARNVQIPHISPQQPRATASEEFPSMLGHRYLLTLMYDHLCLGIVFHDRAI